MPAPPDNQVSALLQAWSQGDKHALDELIPMVYAELRRLARHYMAHERAGHSLQTTALVNEAYVKLAGCQRMHWQSRAHFFAVSAQLMRRILVDHARRHGPKRGGAAQHVSLEGVALVTGSVREDLLALDSALDSLAQISARKARVVELRYFAGLSVEETAHILEVSQITVLRDWRLARAWLHRELTGGVSHEPTTLATD